jgi:hypothetical protein
MVDNSLGQFLTMMACLLLPFGWLAAVVWGIRSSQREAKIIQQHIAHGAYAHWNKPPIARQLRRLVLLKLGSLCGFALALGILVLFRTSPLIAWASGVAAVGFGLGVAVMGGVLYRRVLNGK